MMIRSHLRWGLLALAFGAAAPAAAQNYRVIGAWHCNSGAAMFDIVFNADGYYSGTYDAGNGFRAYSEGPYRLAGTLLNITYEVWVAQPQATPNPGGETYSVQFRGTEAMSLIPTRCPPGQECRLACDRNR